MISGHRFLRTFKKSPSDKPEDADFRLVVNKAISQIYRSGQHAEIFHRWIGRIGIQVPPILAAMYQLNALPE